MNKKEILELLAKVLEIDAVEFENVSEDTALSEIGLDSIRFIELIVAFESKYNVEVYDSDLLMENFATLSAVYKTFKKYFADAQKLYKCVVTDCDGVLWKGIAGEDGKDKAYTDSDTVEYQKLLKSLSDKGIYICICTKNSYDNINAMFVSSIPLKLSDIAITKTDIPDKAMAIKEISAELGISTDSIIFIDDSDYELGLVSAIIPDITVMKSEHGFTAYLNTFFENISEHPLDRTKLYREQKEREKIHITASSADEYNEKLQTKVDCGLASQEDSERIAELSQRTNRFNMSGKRYSNEDIERLINGSECKVFSLKASDIYGDMGLVVAAVVKGSIIENFMLSCRVFGRGFEDVLLNTIKDTICDELSGIFIETGKNKERREFYTRHGITTI